MKYLGSHIKINVNDKLFVKNPDSSVLGRRIVSEGILMIDDIGLEQFTFKKIANQLETTESSIYRYFENKHKFLLYIISYYWHCIDTLIIFNTANINEPEKQLEIVIEMLSTNALAKIDNDGLNMEKLRKIVISESSKSYLTKQVEQENKEGLYLGFKQVCKRVTGFLDKINPSYPYNKMMGTTIVEGILHQTFFSWHLPSLTNRSAGEEAVCIKHFFYQMAISTIKQKDNGH